MPDVQIQSSLNVSTAEFADLYSWYSWPNVVLPIISGLLIDSVFGLRLGTVIFSALCCAGQLLLGLGGGAAAGHAVCGPMTATYAYTALRYYIGK